MSAMDPHHEEHADGIVEDRVQPPPVYFTVLFYGLIVWGVAFMAFYLLSGWSSHDEFQEKMAAHKGDLPVQQQAANPAPAAQVSEPAAAAAVTESDLDSQALYRKHCAGCHGAEGKGAFGPDLTGDYQYGKTSLAVQESIASGRPRSMPGFADKLTPDEIADLTEFILDL